VSVSVGHSRHSSVGRRHSDTRVSATDPLTVSVTLTDTHETLTDTHETLTDTHETLTDTYETLTDTHETLTDTHETLTDTHGPLTDTRVCGVCGHRHSCVCDTHRHMRHT
jgi:hypothetical protein